jgi:hypothetical protein
VPAAAPEPTRPIERPAAGLDRVSSTAPADSYEHGGYDPNPHEPGGGGGDDDGYDEGYDDEAPEPRRSSVLPILGFLLLGIAALVGGGILFTVLNAVPGVAESSSTPSATATAALSEEPSATASPTAGSSAAASAAASAVPQPDNFTAKVQPCASADMGFKGCTQDGSTLTGNKVWVWVGFTNGKAENLIGVSVVNKATGSVEQDGSLTLDRLSGCDPGKTCSGYLTMTFGGLDPGDYELRVTRDGDQVASAPFTVEG